MGSNSATGMVSKRLRVLGSVNCQPEAHCAKKPKEEVGRPECVTAATGIASRMEMSAPSR